LILFLSILGSLVGNKALCTTQYIEQKLTASDGADYDNFGISVSISGDYVILGAYGDYYSSGSAYIFEKPAGGWTDMTETAKLTASDRADGDNFGGSVSIYDDYSIVGSALDEQKGTISGSAYLFERFTLPNANFIPAIQLLLMLGN
jgi:hypothetical protein